MESITAAKCPHCEHVFETQGDVIMALNVACGASSFDHPEVKIGDWEIFFRGWIPSATTVDIRGVVLAYRALPSGRPRDGYYCEAGTTVVREFKSGDCFQLSQTNYFTPEYPRDVLVSAVDMAKDAMVRFINEKSAEQTSSPA